MCVCVRLCWWREKDFYRLVTFQLSQQNHLFALLHWTRFLCQFWAVQALTAAEAKWPESPCKQSTIWVRDSCRLCVCMCVFVFDNIKYYNPILMNWTNPIESLLLLLSHFQCLCEILLSSYIKHTRADSQACYLGWCQSVLEPSWR